jgi:hypothetical protein
MNTSINKTECRDHLKIVNCVLFVSVVAFLSCFAETGMDGKVKFTLKTRTKGSVEVYCRPDATVSDLHRAVEDTEGVPVGFFSISVYKRRSWRICGWDMWCYWTLVLVEASNKRMDEVGISQFDHLVMSLNKRQ